MKKKIIFIIISFFFFYLSMLYANSLSDIWSEVIKKYPEPKPTKEERISISNLYSSLINSYPDKIFKKSSFIYDDISQYPFYIKRHNFTLKNASLIKKNLKPFRKYIKKASVFFDVPEEIISGVIVQESSCNPKAKAKSSSAKGLMQTIDSTFEFARKNVYKHEIIINNPYNPYHSIIAGTWYLSYVFELAKQDYPEYNERKQIIMWEKALEYYYAGPVWGKNPKPIFHAYVNGQKIVIKKSYYSRKVLEYAMIL